MKPFKFIPFNNSHRALFKNKKNLDLADTIKKHSYFNKLTGMITIRFTVPNKKFNVYAILNITKNGIPTIIIYVSDCSNKPIRSNSKKNYVAEIVFHYNEIIPYPGDDFNINTTESIIVKIYNDDSICNFSKSKKILKHLLNDEYNFINKKNALTDINILDGFIPNEKGGGVIIEGP
ncbi:hypothetical protein [uncultured Polaribacter sp.]|uniref:hypothetical protein n=1 Tax=uncultured Polaribacter sp. TaxID=174711 RepID=UPI002608A0B9|nr:hypothetical protein [uncultured Polaribacter sp.]